MKKKRRSTNPQQPTQSALTFPLNDPARIICPVLVMPSVTTPRGETKIDFNPQTDQFTALWDTGSADTYVVPKVVAAANLQRTGFKETGGIGGETVQRDVYQAAVVTFSGLTVPPGGGTVAPSNFLIHATTVVGVERDDQFKNEFDILIGMDIIGRGDMALSTDSRGRRWMSFLHPSRRKRLNLGDINAWKRGR